MICQLTSNIKIRGIGAKVHDNSKYAIINLYFFETIKDRSMIAHLKGEFYLINDLKANLLIGMNIINFKVMMLDFEDKVVTTSICKIIKVFLTTQKKSVLVHRTIRAVSQVIISAGQIMTVFVKLRDAKLSKDCDYSFFSKDSRLLGPKRGFFAHVIDADIKIVQVKNTFDRSFIISKNFGVEHLRDYSKEECFLAASKNCNLVISSTQKLDFEKGLKRETLNKSNELETVLPNEITIYGDREIVIKLVVITEKISQI